jgi:GAG-pre-integrase domain
MSVGHLLNDGLELEGSSSSLEFSAGTSSTKWLLMQFKPHCPGQNIYWLSARLTSQHAILAMSSATTVDYDIMHRRFAHPSKDVLQHASGNTQNFSSNMSFSSNDPVCQGCAEGKMTKSLFPCLLNVQRHLLTKYIWILRSSLYRVIVNTSSLSCSLTTVHLMVRLYF